MKTKEKRTLILSKKGPKSLPKKDVMEEEEGPLNTNPFTDR
jgi:hypothetical protein